ncbi:hypothetical protein CKO20_09780 [Rhodocyclus tenuis]|nr:RNA-binding S4 domain-containing protein [Rhodocyclus tenuis]MBK1680655.1 hypothetical protein [Rhodocyclus tenuis]
MKSRACALRRASNSARRVLRRGSTTSSANRPEASCRAVHRRRPPGVNGYHAWLKPRSSPVTQHTFPLDREFIELNILLKLLGIASSGGAAKAMVAAGLVSVDGVVESRKTRKLRGNETVRVGDDEIRVLTA